MSKSISLSDHNSIIQIIKAISSNGISAFSFGIFQYGINFMLLHQTKSPLSFGMGLTIAPIISLLFFIPIGNFVDSHDHKRIIFWSYLLRIFSFLILASILPFFHKDGLLIPVGIFVATDSFLVETRNTTFSVSVKELVNNKYVPKISSWTTACTSAARILAPVLGVMLYTLISINGLITIEIIATLIAMIILMFLHFNKIKTDNHPIHHTSQAKKFIETLNYMKTRPFVRDSIIAEIVINFFYAGVVTGSPFIIVNELHMNNQTVAWVEMGYSVGYLLGSLVTSMLKNNNNFANRIIFSLITVGIALSGLGILFFISPSELIVVWVGFIMGLIMDFAFAIFDLAIEIRLQSTVEHHILGRVSSTLYTVSYGIMPIGTLVYSGLFSIFSKGSLILIISGIALVVYAFLSNQMFKKDIQKDDQYLNNSNKQKA